MNNKICDWASLPVILSVEETSLILNCSQEQVRKLCRDGIIPAKKVSPRLWAVSKAHLREFLGD